VLRPRLTVVSLALLAVLAACVGDASDRPEGAEDAGTSNGSVVEADTAAAWEPVVRWAVALSGPTQEDEIDGVAAAPDGSAWLTGKFERTATLAGTELVSAGQADIPLARIEPDGDVAFVHSFGGPGEDNLFDLAADERGAVGTGWFTGTIEFDDVTLTSEGSTDCVVVAFDPEGGVRWARSFGGPGPDGCNEVSLGHDGEITTSMDTAGGWTSPAGELDASEDRDTLLMRLDRSGAVEWGRVADGAGAQRGKAIAVAEDGTVLFGGDASGELVLDGTPIALEGGGRDGWLSSWSADGELRWATTWSGPGNDLVKGVVFDGDAVYAVGPHTGIDVGSTTLHAGAEPDLAVVRFDAGGVAEWATTIGADTAVGGAEVTVADDGSLLFAVRGSPGLGFGEADGDVTVPEGDAASTAWLLRYGRDGRLVEAWPIEGTANAGTDELALVDDRLYLDVVVRGDASSAAGEVIDAEGKDGSLWAIDLGGQDGDGDGGSAS